MTGHSNRPLRIAVRADASFQIGTGHVMRCLALMHGLHERGYTLRLISRDLPGHINEMLASRAAGGDFSLTRLPAPPHAPPHAPLSPARDDHASWLGVPAALDAQQTSAALLDGADQPNPGTAYDWLIVDHYALGADWHLALRSHVRRILVIDDVADRNYDCDLLLDQNLNAEPALRYRDRVGAAVTLLLGPRYALQRPEFARLHCAARVRSRVERIAVFFGGVDAAGLTARTLAALAHSRSREIAVDVFVGAANPHQKEIEVTAAALPNARFFGPEVAFAEFLAEADLVVGAGGGNMWERCALGLPSIVVLIAANQVPGCVGAAQAGAICYLGDASDVTDPALAAAVDLLVASPHLMERMSAAASALADGNGVTRVVQAIERVGQLTLRAATEHDRDDLRRWRNDPTVRAASIDANEIDVSTHACWLSTVLADPQRALLIAEFSGRPLGVVRFERHGSAATVSLYRVPGEEAGRVPGIGAELLRAGAEWVARHWPEVDRLDADIREENLRSRAVFERAGYVRTVGQWMRPMFRRGA